MFQMSCKLFGVWPAYMHSLKHVCTLGSLIVAISNLHGRQMCIVICGNYRSMVHASGRAVIRLHLKIVLFFCIGLQGL